DLRDGPGKKTDDYVMNWTSPDDSVRWPVRLEKEATYDVVIDYVAPPASAGGEFIVRLGSQALAGIVRAGEPAVVSLGHVTLPSGEFEINVAATKINGRELMRLRSLQLQSVPPKSARK
ncbi:MAG TPA: hypothetical protein VFV81_03395, partial [Verrucomicrobiae bacterium]|nr:hypothetical protein [Verrucomicrobiae bacterium]